MATSTAKIARRSVQSVDRALDLLEALVAAEGEITITALAARTSLHVSTVHRLLTTLLRRGYVRQNPDTSRYYAGAKLATLAEGRSRYNELRLRARPILQALTEQTRETTNLVVLDDVTAVYIETVPSPQVVRLFTSVGNRVPLHATGAGKALLAWVPAERRDALIARLELRSHTPRTLVDRVSLQHALADF
ncbi:MAG: IclR family transcriptional regulator, partial [Chloroflexota bacterium]